MRCSKPIEWHPHRRAPTPQPTTEPAWDQRGGDPRHDLGPTQPFAHTERARRSIRRLRPAPLADLGLIAARAGLTRFGATTELGNSVSSRPAPSGGARQPLQLLTTAHPLQPVTSHRGVGSGRHAAVLRPGAISSATIDGALSSFAAALGLREPPPAAIVAVGEPQRTLTRYPDGISLLWRETGALSTPVSPSATDLGLGSCLIGTCGVLYPIGETPSLQPVDLGAVAIGTPATPLE